MDYGSILKRAWNITWRYKALWILGLFAGAAGGSGNGGGSSYRGGSTGSSPLSSTQAQLFLSYLRAHAATIVALAVVLVVVGIILWVLHVAARGGLIHLANEAQEGREVRAGAGWSRGFHLWGRVFGVEFLTGLPILIFALVVGGFFAIVAASAIARGAGLSGVDSSLAGLAITGVCFLLIFSVFAIVIGTILSIVAELAVRYAVLQDRHVIDAIGQGWRDLWARRGAFLMWLILVGIGIAFGIVLAVVGLLLVAPGAALILARAYAAGGSLLLVAFLVLLVPSAIYATFHSTVWTLFFRRMTGVDAEPVAAASTYAPPAYGGQPVPPIAPAPPAYEPPPVQPYVPPAPSASPVPPVPPTPPEAPTPPAPPEPPTPPASPMGEPTDPPDA